MSMNTAVLETVGRVASEPPTAQDIERRIVSTLEEALELEKGEFDVNVPFDNYGLDSAEAVNLMGELEDWLGIELAPNLPYEHPTVASLAGRLAELRRG